MTEEKSNRLLEREMILAFLSEEIKSFKNAGEGTCSARIGEALASFKRRLELSDLAPDIFNGKHNSIQYLYIDKPGPSVKIIGIDGIEREVSADVVVTLKP